MISIALQCEHTEAALCKDWLNISPLTDGMTITAYKILEEPSAHHAGLHGSSREIYPDHATLEITVDLAKPSPSTVRIALGVMLVLQSESYHALTKIITVQLPFQQYTHLERLTTLSHETQKIRHDLKSYETMLNGYRKIFLNISTIITTMMFIALAFASCTLSTIISIGALIPVAALPLYQPDKHFLVDDIVASTLLLICMGIIFIACGSKKKSSSLMPTATGIVMIASSIPAILWWIIPYATR